MTGDEQVHEVTLRFRRAPRWLVVYRRRRARRHPGRVVTVASTAKRGRWVHRLVPYRCRRLHHRFADLAGFFWIPCPLCGREFGGHEWRAIGGRPSSVPNVDGGGTGICPRCTRAGRGVQ